MLFNPYYGYHNYPYSVSINLPEAVIRVILSAGLFSFIVGAALYFFQAAAIYTIGNKRGMKNAFLAFIPVVNMYFLGKIADDIKRTMNKKTNYANRILAFYIVSLAAGAAGTVFICLSRVYSAITGRFSFFVIPAVILMIAAFVFAVVTTVFSYIALHVIYKEYTPANAALFTVLSVLFSFVMPFLLFSIRNNKSGYQLWCEQQAAFRANNAGGFDSSNQ